MWDLSFKRRRSSTSSCCALAALALWAGCSGEGLDLDEGAGQAPGANIGGQPGFAPGVPAAGSSGNAGVPELPPEEEKESSFRLPVLSGRWVWAANAESGRVAVIDTRSLSVQLAQAGFAPSFLAALPAEEGVQSAAIVLNARSRNATRMRLTQGALEASSVPTHEGANSWALSPSGRWAIAWSDAEVIENADRTEAFQDITVIDTVTLSATRLSVGYRPSRIFIQQDESRAFVVCQPGISVVELNPGGPVVTRDILLSDDTNEQAIDVAVMPDGSHAIARVEGRPHVTIVELTSGARTFVTLSGPVTDLDLVGDGSTAIAVVRGQPVSAVTPRPGAQAGASGQGGSESSGGTEAVGGLGWTEGGAAAGGGDNALGGESGASGSGASSGGESGQGGAPDDGSPPPTSGYSRSQVAVLSIPSVVVDPEDYRSVFIDDLIGSVAVSDGGTMAVLYTTASALERVVILPTEPELSSYLVPRPVPVRAPVKAVFVSPDSEHAIVLLERAQGGAFGVVPLGMALPVKFQTTDAEVTGVAFAPPPTRSAVVTAKTGLTAYVAHLPSLLVHPIGLPSLPLSAGIIPEENTAFVVQEHPEGRLSLIDLESAEERTLTGFELAAGLGNDTP